MPDANPNATWCRLLALALQRAGLQRVLLCPGNRNVPLAFALDALPGIAVTVHQEERSAAFAALGHSRASGQPTAICTTSGSAVANCLPALCEAWHARLPLVLLSAARPPELQDCEAPQAMRQLGLTADFCRAQLALPPADEALRRSDELLRSVHEALTGPGPVQFDCAFRDPLPPLPDPGWTPPSRGLPALPQAAEPQQAPPDWRRLLRPGMRGLLVVGPRCPLAPEAVDALAQASGFPVLADAASDLRRHPVAHRIDCADALCAGSLGRQPADVLLRLGPAPVARPVWEYLQRHEGPVLRLDDHAVAADFCHRRFDMLLLPGPRPPMHWLQDLPAGDAAWRHRWLAAATAAQAARSAWLAASAWGEITAAAVLFEAAAGFDFCHVGNSMAVRHANLHLLRAAPTCYANRGVNGIDGTVGTFLGECLAQGGGRGLLVCGELSLLHDLPALGLPREGALPVLAVIHNGGGGIFDLLPVRDCPGYQHLIRSLSGIDLAAAAASFGWRHHRCEDADSLRRALQQADEACLLEIRVPPDSVRQHRELVAAMAAAGS